jgi:hypothetical protein
MDNDLPAYGYVTKEATHVFSYLASRAAERIGLIGRLAQTFGGGYSWIRTGWFEPTGLPEQKQVIMQLFFLKIFFPLGGYFTWDFDSPVVKTKLEVVINMFVAWQDNPRKYLQDIKDYKTQLEPLWQGLSSALGFSKEFHEPKPFRDEVQVITENLFS